MEVSIIGSINQMGYGVVCSNLVHELVNLDVKVNLFPIGPMEYSLKHKESIEKSLNNSKGMYSVKAPCVRIWHQHDLHMFVGRGKHIGFPIFELDTFTDSERHQLSNCDELIVCSRWAEHTLNDNLLEKQPPTYVLNLGVDRDVFYEEDPYRKSTVFLNVGKWEVRKGHDILPTIWKKAFPKENNEDVELWLMFDNPFFADKMDMLKSEYNDNRVKFIPRLQSNRQVADIMRQSHCGIFPARAEGWNLELLEMMACGKPCIATNYSAHQEMAGGFIRINPGGLEPAHGRLGLDDRWFFGQGNWAFLGSKYIKEFSEEMRKIHKNNFTINEKGVILSKRLSWRSMAKKFIEIVH